MQQHKKNVKKIKGFEYFLLVLNIWKCRNIQECPFNVGIPQTTFHIMSMKAETIQVDYSMFERFPR